MTDTTTRALPAQRPTPVLPVTPGSVALATVPGASHHRRVWELHPDGKWCDTYGARRSPSQLRDVEILRVAPDLEGSAA